ncbi:MAG: tRNA (adenosine(37)-N6)-dimethylallyltransferase MiaA [Candidatus Omnitrophota bacterium]|jgi:tRNA dimethylallyltransferase
MLKKIIFLVGPTAIGKTETAVYLAKRIGAEIISCDSMQVYKGMDIITSKPKPSLRKKIKHHLLSVIPMSKDYDVSAYRKDAIKKVKEIISRGKVPLFVGGTGLYMDILVDGIFEEEINDKPMRDKLYEIAKKKGSVYLHNQLKKVDPEASEKIHPNDTKRIIRALGVFRATGKPISSLQKNRRGLRDEYDVRVFCLNTDRNELYKRIDARVEEMFKNGLIKEVKRVLKKTLSRTASFAIGLREAKGYLSGDYGLGEAKSMIKLNTRRYAKRQLTWFRKDKSIKWIDIKEKETPQAVAKRLCNL